MKDSIAITFENVSKKFKKGQRLFLKQALLDFFKTPRQEDFWALRNINFTVFKGETVGIIGANGSGKSTVLKLIAGVLTPTRGKIEVNGRIGPLIELGAGFHPELSGRDNIYLNGTILGLSKKEVDEKFDDIVTFSELGEFIDTPVKHYSSGMYMRLGFSIAIHINPEILLVDEILAVGDIAFQKKCLEKIEDLKNKKVTIVFVSHSLEVIQNVSDRVLYLDGGEIVSQGNPKPVIASYFGQLLNQEGKSLPKAEDSKRWGDGLARVVQVWLEDSAGQRKTVFGKEIIKIFLKVKFMADCRDPIFGITIRSQNNLAVFVSNTKWRKIKTGNFKKGQEKIISFKFRNFFDSGKYFVSPAIAYSDEVRFYDWRENFVAFLVKKPYQTGGVVNFDHFIEII